MPSLKLQVTEFKWHHDTQHNDIQHNNNKNLTLSTTTFSTMTLETVMLSVIHAKCCKLALIMHSAIMLNAVMLNVVVPFYHYHWTSLDVANSDKNFCLLDEDQTSIKICSACTSPFFSFEIYKFTS